MTGLLLRVRAGQACLVLPDSVLTQVWRGGTGRQARIAALLGLKSERCVTVPLETAAARVAPGAHLLAVFCDTAISARWLSELCRWSEANGGN